MEIKENKLTLYKLLTPQTWPKSHKNKFCSVYCFCCVFKVQNKLTHLFKLNLAEMNDNAVNNRFLRNLLETRTIQVSIHVFESFSQLWFTQYALCLFPCVLMNVFGFVEFGNISVCCISTTIFQNSFLPLTVYNVLENVRTPSTQLC